MYTYIYIYTVDKALAYIYNTGIIPVVEANCTKFTHAYNDWKLKLVWVRVRVRRGYEL